MLFQDIRHHPGHFAFVQTQKPMEHDILSGNGDVGLQLGPPVSRLLLHLQHGGGGSSDGPLDPIEADSGKRVDNSLAAD
jgi:hypothetical protein